MPRWCIAWIAVGLSITAGADEAPLFRFTAPAGAHAVGLSVVEQSDPSRAWGPEKRARPLQTLIWYPARRVAEPMTVRDYVNLWARETSFGRPALSAKAREWRVSMQRTLETPLRAGRDAPAVAERFPLIVYAPGASNPAWENADFCEYLASHGYVVVASASLGSSDRAMETELAGAHAQARDISFLIDFAGALENADLSRIAVIGLSWGGLSNLLAASGDSRIDALVSLDGSFRYFPGVAQSGGVQPARMTIPLLAFLQRNFSLEDQDRYISVSQRSAPSMAGRRPTSLPYICWDWPMRSSARSISGGKMSGGSTLSCIRCDRVTTGERTPWRVTPGWPAIPSSS